MVKIYLACRGFCSDFDIIGAFTDRAAAERVAKAVDPLDGTVQEHEVDSASMLSVAAEALRRGPSAQLWKVTSQDGSIAAMAPYYALIIEPSDVLWQVSATDTPHVLLPGVTCRHLNVMVFAEDGAHAAKIAADKFREYAALTGWPGKPVAAPSS